MSGYRLTRHGHGFRLEDGESLALIARIEPRIETYNGPPTGWRFKPVTFMGGPASKVWPTVADALVGYRLMTPGKARKAVAAAGVAPAAPKPVPPA